MLASFKMYSVLCDWKVVFKSYQKHQHRIMCSCTSHAFTWIFCFC